MSKPIYITCLLLAALNLAACTGSPINTGNTSDQQRSHAREAQDELSTEVDK